MNDADILLLLLAVLLAALAVRTINKSRCMSETLRRERLKVEVLAECMTCIDGHPVKGMDLQLAFEARGCSQDEAMELTMEVLGPPEVRLNPNIERAADKLAVAHFRQIVEAARKRAT